MTSEPNPAWMAPPTPIDPVASSGSMADFAAATTRVPRPAALTLDVARHHAFTGEITFHDEPIVRAYLDGGVVYHAERDGDPSVSESLLIAGVVDTTQLQRGMVRVGDVEHLGRLFDRDLTIDRDAVSVLVEQHTDDVITSIAASGDLAASICAYRHHRSGLHRWFVAPVDHSGPSARPSSGVAQVDRSVVDDLPDLGRAGEGVKIEWDEPDPTGLGVPLATTPNNGAGDAEVQAELDRFDADHADWAMGPMQSYLMASETAVVSPLGEFHIVWPDGTEDDSLVDDDPSLAPPPDPPIGGGTLDTPPVTDAWGDRPFELTIQAPIGSATDEPRFTELPAPSLVHLDPVMVERLPAPDVAVPDDVAAAVRRALQAIDEASLRRDSAATRRPRPVDLPRLEMPTSSSGSVRLVHAKSTVATPPPAPAVPPPPPVGFAPPTLDMRAEAVFQRIAAEADGQAEMADVVVAEPIVSTPERERGNPSVVFRDEVADEPAPQPADSNARRGALRRLISSLRGD